MGILGRIDTFITWFDGVVWGLPLIILILVIGIFLTVRLGLLQVRYLGKALKFMVKNEEDGHGEVTSFGALCTALSATIGTGNIVGVATAISAGGPGALFWMILTAFLGIDYEKIQDSIREIFQRKGDAIVELNLKALAAGKEIAEKTMK